MTILLRPYFKPCAKKYDIDYTLRKDSSTHPPRYIVIFKTKQADNLTTLHAKRYILNHPTLGIVFGQVSDTQGLCL